MGEKLPSKPTFKILRRLSQQDDIFGEAISTLMGHLMISPAFLALHNPKPPPIVNSLVPSAALSHEALHFTNHSWVGGHFPKSSPKEPFAQTSSLHLISLQLWRGCNRNGSRKLWLCCICWGRRARNDVLFENFIRIADAHGRRGENYHDLIGTASVPLTAAIMAYER